jgi:hypothetical protein
MADDKTPAELYADHAGAIRKALGLGGSAIACMCDGWAIRLEKGEWQVCPDGEWVTIPDSIAAAALDSALAQAWWERAKVNVLAAHDRGGDMHLAVTVARWRSEMWEVLSLDGRWGDYLTGDFPSLAAANCAVAEVLAKELDAAKPAEPTPCPRCAELQEDLDTVRQQEREQFKRVVELKQLLARAMERAQQARVPPTPPYCNCYEPTKRYQCTEQPGHAGEHIAKGPDGKVYKRWPQEPVSEVISEIEALATEGKAIGAAASPLTGTAWLDASLATGKLKAGDAFDYRGDGFHVAKRGGTVRIVPWTRFSDWAMRTSAGWEYLSHCFPFDSGAGLSDATVTLHTLPPVEGAKGESNG